MKILVACEFSGRIRDALIRLGHDAISCDLLPTEVPGPHIQGNVLDILDGDYDLMIAHPPCTHLAVSGARWFSSKSDELRIKALDFFCKLLNAPIPQICIENPVGIVSTHVRRFDQIIQPYYYGTPQRKTTCLWLKALPHLRPTLMVKPILIKYPKGSVFSQHYNSRTGNKHQALERSRTFYGIAKAMADQWSDCQSYLWASREFHKQPTQFKVVHI
jgi:hypothetical protein